MKPMLLVVLMALSGCSGAPLRLDLSAQAAGGQLSYGAPTLAAAKRVFFGTGSTSGGSGGDGGGDLLSPQDPVTLHGLPPTVTQLTLSRQDDLGGGMVLRSSAMAGYQHLRGTLPQGFGVLTDPMQIEIWARSLGLQMTLGAARPLPLGLHLDYAAGLGVAQSGAATHLQSALIDLRGESRQILPYVLAEARLTGSTGPSILASLLVLRSGATEVRLGVAQSF